jgi:hypothetical protein
MEASIKEIFIYEWNDFRFKTLKSWQVILDQI